MNRNPREAIGTLDPVEAMARFLVAALLPLLEASMNSGLTYRQTMTDARGRVLPRWRDQYGAAVALRAREILDHVGPAAILTPYGRTLFLREYPLGAIPMPPPVEAIEGRTPAVGIGRLLRRSWVAFWRVSPASAA